ncbi:MAG TPA: protoporphyrinogen oxidase [Vicinamibacterales bacterium]
MLRIAIVGGGLSGLALAHAIGRAAPGLRDRLVVLERDRIPGGHLRTERIDGFLCEAGPGGLLDSSAATLELIDQLGLTARITPASDVARRRYLLIHGALHLVPTSPPALLRSPLLSAAGKLRLLAEPLVPRGGSDDETIHAFVARRFGRQAADLLAGPFATGVFAGDARQLSMRACFPAISELEARHGSLIRALMARRHAGSAGSARRSPGRQFSFREGLGELAMALTATLGSTLRTGARVETIERREDGWGVRLASGESLHAAAVVLACGARRTAALLYEIDAALAHDIAGIAEPPVAVVCLGYETSAVGRPLDGYGFLVASGERVGILGALWDSTIYPGRAPDGHVLLRVMIGGQSDPEAAALPDAALVQRAHEALATVMPVTRPAVLARVYRHMPGIPQYAPGHLARVARIADRLTRHPGLFLAGNAYRGVSMPSCIEDAAALAPQVAADAAARCAAAQYVSPNP